MAAPFDAAPCECPTGGRDGVDDLVLRFSTDELVDVLDLDSLPAGSSVTLTLSGALHDGTAFEASDCIVLGGHGATPLSAAVPEPATVDGFRDVVAEPAKALPR